MIFTRSPRQRGGGGGRPEEEGGALDILVFWGPEGKGGGLVVAEGGPKNPLYWYFTVRRCTDLVHHSSI